MIIFNSKLTNYQRVIWWCHSSTWTTGCINKAGMLYSGFRGFRGCLPRYPHCQWSYVQQKQMPSRMMDKQPFGRCRVNQEFQREISPKSRRGWSARIDPLPGYQKWRPKRWQCPPPRDCQRSLHHEAPRFFQSNKMPRVCQTEWDVIHRCTVTCNQSNIGTCWKCYYRMPSRHSKKWTQLQELEKDPPPSTRRNCFSMESQCRSWKNGKEMGFWTW